MTFFRVLLRRGAATLEQTILAVSPDDARGACAWQERDGWRWVRTDAIPVDKASGQEYKTRT